MTPQQHITKEQEDIFRNRWEGANLQNGSISTLVMDEMLRDINSLIETALTNYHNAVKRERLKTLDAVDRYTEHAETTHINREWVLKDLDTTNN